MCGRYEKPGHPDKWKELFDLYQLTASPPAEDPRTEVFPTNTVPIYPNDGGGLVDASWSLLGPWSKSPKKYDTFNARADKLGSVPGFWKRPAEAQRCLVPATAIWEWPKSGPKKGHRIRLSLAGEVPFCMAGLWNRWDGKLSFTIVTTEPTDWFSQWHHREALFVTPDAARAWLNPEPVTIDQLGPLLVPFDGAMIAFDETEAAQAA